MGTTKTTTAKNHKLAEIADVLEKVAEVVDTYKRKEEVATKEAAAKALADAMPLAEKVAHVLGKDAEALAEKIAHDADYREAMEKLAYTYESPDVMGGPADDPTRVKVASTADEAYDSFGEWIVSD